MADQPCLTDVLRQLRSTLENLPEEMRRSLGRRPDGAPGYAARSVADQGEAGSPAPAEEETTPATPAAARQAHAFTSTWQQFVPDFRRFASAFARTRGMGPGANPGGAATARAAASAAGPIPGLPADPNAPSAAWQGVGRTIARQVAAGFSAAWKASSAAAGASRVAGAGAAAWKASMAGASAFGGAAASPFVAGVGAYGRAAARWRRATSRARRIARAAGRRPKMFASMLGRRARWDASSAASRVRRSWRTAAARARFAGGDAGRVALAGAAGFGGAAASPFVAAAGAWHKAAVRLRAGRMHARRLARAAGSHARWAAAMFGRRVAWNAASAASRARAAWRQGAFSARSGASGLAHTASSRAASWAKRAGPGAAAFAGRAAGMARAGLGVARVAGGAAVAFGGGLASAVVQELVADGLAIAKSLRTVTENINASNRQFARYNPRIAAAHAMLDFGDFRRNVRMGRELQDVASGLAGNVDRMRDAWQGFDAFTARVRNGVGSFGAGVMEELGKGASHLVEGLNGWLRQNDPNSNVANRAGRALLAPLNGAIQGWQNGGIMGMAQGAGAAAVNAWNGAPPPRQPMPSPWSEAMHQIVRQGPLVRPHAVPPP